MNVRAGAIALLLALSSSNAATIMSRPDANGRIVVSTDSTRFAGAVNSIVQRGVQSVNRDDHGRLCQSALSVDYYGEARNPTEGGSMRDGAGYTSTSKLLFEVSDGRKLYTRTQMAYWLPWNNSKLSSYEIEKWVTLGFGGMDNVIEYATEYSIPRGEILGNAVFEALTCYMPPSFSNFMTYDYKRGAAVLSDGPGEQSLPIIAYTNNGLYAMGVYSPDSPQQDWPQAGYGRWRFPDTTKWNNVFRVNNPSGNYRFRSFIVVGTILEVQTSMRKLIEMQLQAH